MSAKFSRRWWNLKRGVEALRKQFLPDRFDPLGVYQNRERIQAHTRAYVVLCHAECESYLEDWAKDIARASEKVWTSSGRVPLAMACLLSTYGNRISIPTSLSKAGVVDVPQRFSDEATRMFNGFYGRIKDNHGVKEHNVLSLLGPLGVGSGAFSSTLLPNLNTFGALRGSFAHSSTKAVVSTLDPETEYQRLEMLLVELQGLDVWLASYYAKIR